PVIEPGQEVCPVVGVAQLSREIRCRSGGAARQHLADQGEVALALALTHRRFGLPEEFCPLDRLPERRGFPAATIGVPGGHRVAGPLLGRIRPHARKLVKPPVGPLDAQLAEALAFVDKLHAHDAAGTVPAIALPDSSHPVFVGGRQFLCLVVDPATVGTSAAELEARATPTAQMECTAWRVV